VPNADRQIVALGDLLRSKEAQKATHPLEVAIGRDIQGKAKLMNLAKMPHLLIAGATGSGKSSGINGIITSILMRSTPADVRMILVDPKMVEMTQYERVPHLLTQPVTDPRKAANALAWACREMDRRYELLAGQGFRDIAGFNKAFDAGQFDKDNQEIEDNESDTRRQISRLPFILIVVDELADLMMVAARDVEDSICRIAQKARAVGIHLIIATQRPSTNVITGIIRQSSDPGSTWRRAPDWPG
jgi:S-DNA-T family DNA segregation ATPase FtsK/SpoIIIE